MMRGRKILIVCHCVLNANAKVYPLAPVPGVFTDAIASHVSAGCGLFQLPCPETAYLGMNRWGMTKEQYDHPLYRAHCRNILEAPLAQLSAFKQAGYEFTGLVGMDGSPNCGVHLTCEGYTGGDITSAESVAQQGKALKFLPGKGVFMTELLDLLHASGIRPELSAIRETPPDEPPGLPGMT